MESNCLYHLFNRGNNRGTIFYTQENYLFFLRKVRNHLLDHVDILAYCLMPNHFHFLIQTKTNIDSKEASNGLRVLLRSYARAINKQEKRSGSLFQQHSKIKDLNEGDDDYAFTCFHYIHQNPVRAGIVDKMEAYEMSSFRDYAGFRNGTLCNKEQAEKSLDIDIRPDHFIKDSYAVKSESYYDFES